MTTAGDVGRVVAALAAGEVVLIPTDTVYGLAADPRSAQAMHSLFELKNRPEGVPIAVLVDSLEQAQRLVIPNPFFDELAGRYWPGALTLIGEKRPGVELHVGSDETVGIRMPDHALVAEVVRRVGPIAATSANIHGQSTISDIRSAREVFGDRIGVIVDGGPLAAFASTIVDTTTDPPAVLRRGGIDVGAAVSRFRD